MNTAETPARTIGHYLAVGREEMPRRLHHVVQLLLKRPESYFDADDLARHAGVSRRHVDRMLRSIGIASARRLVVTVRALHAVDRIVARQQSITAAAESLGYANRTVLTRHIKTILDRSPSQLGDGLRSSDIQAAARRFVSGSLHA